MTTKTDIYLETFDPYIFSLGTKIPSFISDNDKNVGHSSNRSEVRPYDYFSQNEIRVTSKLKKIHKYQHFFNIFVEYNRVKVGQLNEKNIEKMDYYNENHILFFYNDKNKVTFNNFIISFNNSRDFFLNLFESYREIIKILCLLYEKSLCVFNISSQTIVFDDTFKPMLTNFKKTIEITHNMHLNQHIEEIITNEDFVYKPIELHLLYYLIKNEDFQVNSETIDIILNNYVNEIKIFKLFSATFRIEFMYSAETFLKKYLNLSKNEIIEDIFSYAHTWDNYSVSFIYLFVVLNVTKIFSLNEGFISRFLNILTRIIQPEPSKRLDVCETYKMYCDLFKSCENWDFVYDISNEKLYELYEKMC